MTEEVFDRLAPARQTFLVQTAILERLCGGIYDAVTGNQDSQSLLEELAREDPAVLDRFMGGWAWEALIYALWESFFMVAALIFLVHLFRTRFNQAGRLPTFLAANVYTVYIIHQTILYSVNIGLLALPWPSIVKFFAATAITIPLCFG